VGLFVFSVRRGHRKSDADLLLMAIPCAVLVSYHTYPHDLSVLLLPMLVLLDSVILKMPPRKLLFNPAALMFVSAAVVYFFPNQIFWLASVVFLLLLQASKSCMPLTLAPEVGRGDAADLDRRNLAESTAAGLRSSSGV